ncbi:MAG: hypothetical protein I3273_06970 [Candidatus Moeniiplasma glomeromycotorum]|nr:hypothetical protein [Candidatus Moeniiplasma glomeromycotorum]MCE8168263.1 hypothetical protein [Candidatus Moeniiplasma glomeromycotorum]MCE8169828.1 hypothetical protein [Candidatus Moeniiplasma glomeromycotorum]
MRKWISHDEYYNEQNMEIEEEFLKRWNKHKNIVVGRDRDNLEWYDEVIKDLEPYLEEPNIVKVAFDWKNWERFSFKYYLENPIKTWKYDTEEENPNKYDEVVNKEAEKFFDGYKPLASLEAFGATPPDEFAEIWFEGTGRVLTFHFKNKAEGLKTWLRAIKAKREKYLEKNSSPKLVDATTQTELTAEKISQMEAQIEVLLKKNG